jgi:hypothetical protein
MGTGREWGQAKHLMPPFLELKKLKLKEEEKISSSSTEKIKLKTNYYSI